MPVVALMPYLQPVSTPAGDSRKPAAIKQWVHDFAMAIYATRSNFGHGARQLATVASRRGGHLTRADLKTPRFGDHFAAARWLYGEILRMHLAKAGLLTPLSRPVQN